MKKLYISIFALSISISAFAQIATENMNRLDYSKQHHQKEMLDINEDMLKEHPDDLSHLLNTSPQTFKNMWKNAMYQAGNKTKPGPKRARATKLWNEYIEATPARRKRMVREGYTPMPPE